MDFQNGNIGPNLKQESFKDAFSYMFKVKNMWIFAVICIVSIFLSSIAEGQITPNVSSMVIGLVGSCLSFFVTGYVLIMIRDFTTQHFEYKLPKFNFVEIFIYAIKFSVAIALGLVIPCIFCIIWVMVTANLLPIFISTALYVVLVCLFLYLFPAFFWLFANTQQMTAFLQYKKIFALIRCNFRKYNTAFWIFAGLTFLLCVLIYAITAPFMTYVTDELGKQVMVISNPMPLVIVSVLGTYVSLVVTFIVAKCLDIKPTVNEQN